MVLFSQALRMTLNLSPEIAPACPEKIFFVLYYLEPIDYAMFWYLKETQLLDGLWLDEHLETAKQPRTKNS